MVSACSRRLRSWAFGVFSVRPDPEPGKRSARRIIPLVGDWELGFLWILELEIWNFRPATLIFREWRSAPEASTLNRNVAERRGDN
jgi:hypothetical protein